MSVNYSVIIEDFTQKHFIKNFKKKYKAHWDTTMIAITAQLERIDNLLKSEKAEFICGDSKLHIIKTEFRVSGTKESAKSSGNRCIVAWNENKNTVNILLMYHKDDLKGTNETIAWKKLIRDNYEEYKDLL